MSAKVKVEIWSDIMCPFCYIGKRNFEAGLKQTNLDNEVEIEWKSYQLDPSIPKQNDKQQSVYDYLAERKGMQLDEVMKLHENVVQIAKNAGLTYNFDTAKVANSFDAHRVIQLAKTKGLGDKAEERFFYAYFTEGKDFSNHDVLFQLGQEIGLSKEDVLEALTNPTFEAKVKQDIQEAQEIGVRGVPFFVFNRKYAVSGAQPVEVFANALQQSLQEA